MDDHKSSPVSITTNNDGPSLAQGRRGESVGTLAPSQGCRQRPRRSRRRTASTGMPGEPVLLFSRFQSAVSLDRDVSAPLREGGGSARGGSASLWPRGMVEVKRTWRPLPWCLASYKAASASPMSSVQSVLVPSKTTIAVVPVQPETAERAPNSDLRARLEHVGNRTAPGYAGPDMSHPPWHHGPDAVVLILRSSRWRRNARAS